MFRCMSLIAFIKNESQEKNAKEVIKSFLAEMAEFKVLKSRFQLFYNTSKLNYFIYIIKVSKI